MNPAFKLTAAAFAAAVLMTTGFAHAADDNLSRSDTRFLQRAAQSGQLEMDASKLALERAESQEVREFAERMINDHQEMDTELRALAQSRNVELPDRLRWGQNRAIKGLENREGQDFDRRYADRIAVDAHGDAVELFEDAAENADDEEVRGFAEKGLPTLREHLSMGEQLLETVEARDDAMRPAAPATAPMTQPGGAGSTPPAGAPAAPAAPGN